MCVEKESVVISRLKGKELVMSAVGRGKSMVA